MKINCALVLLIILLVFVSMSFAERDISQLGEDAYNAAMVWTEVPKSMYERGLDVGPLAGAVIGPVIGSYNLFERTAMGIDSAIDHKPTRNEVSGLRLIYKF